MHPSVPKDQGETIKKDKAKRFKSKARKVKDRKNKRMLKGTLKRNPKQQKSKESVLIFKCVSIKYNFLSV